MGSGQDRGESRSESMSELFYVGIGQGRVKSDKLRSALGHVTLTRSGLARSDQVEIKPVVRPQYVVSDELRPGYK